jgi:hypothetical protein
MKKYSPKLILVVSMLSILPLFYGGCASGVTRPTDAAAAGYRLADGKKVSEVRISVLSAVRDKLKDSLKFDDESLRRHVEQALIGYSVFDASKKGTLPVVEILVTNVRVRSTFNAVMWGFMAGSDSIDGDVVIKDPSGHELDHFSVSASYALGGFAGGQDSMRMDWLYEAFAKETVKELTGLSSSDEPAKTENASQIGTSNTNGG